MMSAIAQEEVKLDALQRVWQNKRSATSLFENDIEHELLSLLPRQISCAELPAQSTSSETVVPVEVVAVKETHKQENLQDSLEESRKSPGKTITLDASELGDIPARYVITPVEAHQFPVIGVYIDKRVIAGFRYRVRPLPAVGEDLHVQHPVLFDDRALTLQNIGRGYARRFTFESASRCHNNNYFWSDNCPEGYAFELEVISVGDKFTIFDANREPCGTVEITKIEGNQTEIATNVSSETIEKRVKVRFIGKVEFFETLVAKPTLLSGVVVCFKRKNCPRAEVAKVINVNIKNHRYTLVPGVQKVHRRVTVKGQDINDVPTKYTMSGLESYEIPVVGTYLDPRIMPGFHYKVRPNDREERLFNGRSLKLMSVGMGYAKRLTFEPDSLVNPDNYLWSDSHPDGLGLEPRAVHTGMKFQIHADGQVLGEASVFKADMPQREERMEKVLTPSGLYAIEKYIHIDVMCHLKINIPGGNSVDREEQLMRVYGLAVVRKEPRINDSYILRVENVGLDSQLNVIFAQNHTELTFFPLRFK